MRLDLFLIILLMGSHVHIALRDVEVDLEDIDLLDIDEFGTDDDVSSDRYGPQAGRERECCVLTPKLAGAQGGLR